MKKNKLTLIVGFIVAFVLTIINQGMAQTCNNTKYIRVNIHYMQKDDGSNNFAEFDDGIGNVNYSGYHYAEELISNANNLLANVHPENLPPATVTPVITYRYVLHGVYFDKETDLNTYNGSMPATSYGKNITSEINIFLQASNCGAMAGAANWYGPDLAYYFVIGTSPWDCYVGGQTGTCFAPGGAAGWPFNSFDFGKLVNHELGHLLGLQHTWDNQCADANAPQSSWCDANSDRNIMNYSCLQDAFTVCQNNIMNANLQLGTLKNYVVCGTTPPATALFRLKNAECSYLNIELDGSWRLSKNETSYKIEIFRTSSVNSSTPIGTVFTQNNTGTYGTINLSNLYTFTNGNIYCVSLTVTDAAGRTHNSKKWLNNSDIYLQNLTVNTNRGFYSKCYISGGRNVNPSATQGDFVINSPGTVTIQAGKRVLLTSGTYFNGGDVQVSINPNVPNINTYQFRKGQAGDLSFSDPSKMKNLTCGLAKNPSVSPSNEEDLASLSEAVHVWPNPSKDNFNISIDGGDLQNANVVLYNSNGSIVPIVQRINNNSIRIETQGSLEGLYVIKVRANNKEIYKKIILEK